LTATLVTVPAGNRAGGHAQGLGASAAIPRQVRSEVARGISSSAEAATATRELCRFDQDHSQPDASRVLSQYISLALVLEGPPNFNPKAKQAELPPDAVRVLGIAPLLKTFYEKTNLHQIWLRHRNQY